MKRLIISTMLIAFIVASISNTRFGVTSANNALAVTPQQTPAPSPTPDVELEEAKRRTALDQERQKQAEARKAELEANNARLKAEIQPLGAPTNVSVPAGNVTTDQEGFVEVQMLAQQAANQISAKLASSLCGKQLTIQYVNAAGSLSSKNVTLGTLVIYSNSDIAALSLYRPMMDQLKRFETDFNNKHAEVGVLLAKTNPAVLPPDFLPLAIPAVPAAATMIVKSVAELVNLFRSDTQFQNKKVPITDDVVVAYIVEALQTSAPCSPKPAVYFPALYPPLLFAQTKSDLIDQLATVSAARTTAVTDLKNIDDRIKLINTIAGNIEKLKAKQKAKTAKEKERTELNDPRCRTAKCKQLTKEINELQQQIEGETATINQQTGNNVARFQSDHEMWLEGLTRIKPLIQALIEAADKIITSLNTPDASNRVTALATLLGAERLKKILDQETSFTLRASVTANGTTKIKKNIFVDAKVRHTAGADLAFQLFDYNGGVAYGGGMHCYFDYQSAQDVRRAISDIPIKCSTK